MKHCMIDNICLVPFPLYGLTYVLTNSSLTGTACHIAHTWTHHSLFWYICHYVHTSCVLVNWTHSKILVTHCTIMICFLMSFMTLHMLHQKKKFEQQNIYHILHSHKFPLPCVSACAFSTLPQWMLPCGTVHTYKALVIFLHVLNHWFHASAVHVWSNLLCYHTGAPKLCISTQVWWLLSMFHLKEKSMIMISFTSKNHHSLSARIKLPSIVPATNNT